MNPQLSLVLPTYNRGKSYLRQAIMSVLAQDFENFELIIVDDGSTDDTINIIAEFQDKRIICKRSNQNFGEYWSTNYAISQAKGTFVTWIHSDDILPPHSLITRITELQKNPTLDFVHGDIERINAEGNVIEKVPAVDWPKEQLIEEYLKMPEERTIKYLMHHTTIMMKREFFDITGPFDTTLPYAGDIDWLIRAILKGTFTYIPHVLYRYRSHEQTRRVVDIQGGVNKNEVLRTIIQRYK